MPIYQIDYIWQLTIMDYFSNTHVVRNIFLPNFKSMDDLYIVDQHFEKNNAVHIPLPKGEYENCTFSDFDFSNSDFSMIRFTDCTFNRCNLSLVKLTQTSFRDAVFKECKMLGLSFDQCIAFGLSFRFENCMLNHASFYKTNIKKTIFKQTTLHETDFTDCDASGASFDGCDLSRAVFENTNLEKADLGNAYNYSIDPEKNRIKKARFSQAGLAGLLEKYHIDIV